MTGMSTWKMRAALGAIVAGALMLGSDSGVAGGDSGSGGCWQFSWNDFATREGSLFGEPITEVRSPAEALTVATGYEFGRPYDRARREALARAAKVDGTEGDQTWVSLAGDARTAYFRVEDLGAGIGWRVTEERLFLPEGMCGPAE